MGELVSLIPRKSPPAVLSVEGAAKRYGPRTALAEISLTVGRGEIVALLGPNGAGKTTLFRIIEGLVPADGGRVVVGGHDITRSPVKALATLGIVFQEPTLDLDLTVVENLAYYAALRGIPRRWRAAAIETGLARLGLGDRATSRARELSGGLRRRAELARALIGAPSLLLLDEPTDALDPASRKALRGEIDRLRRVTGCGVLWATHLVDEVATADRVVILDRGLIVAEGDPAAIIAAHGKASLTDAFLSLTGGGGAP